MEAVAGVASETGEDLCGCRAGVQRDCVEEGQSHATSAARTREPALALSPTPKRRATLAPAIAFPTHDATTDQVTSA